MTAPHRGNNRGCFTGLKSLDSPHRRVVDVITRVVGQQITDQQQSKRGKTFSQLGADASDCRKRRVQ